MACLNILLFISQSQCTGVSPLHSYINNPHRTNPAREYGHAAILSKGGLFYHRGLIAGQTGNAKRVKSGQACSHAILWLAAFGNSGLNQARKNGQLTKIALVEYEVFAIGGFVYHRFCTRVHGE
ncbi:MAG: TRL-like family protein [Leptospiraceae bacterium]|nr:TRL-like family protein [Leptospiraceae bacterium]